jgi:ribosome biogenesis GTPase A
MTLEYCRGCGTPLQTDAPDSPGFIPPELLEQKGSNSFICKRCYRIIHYGESGTIQPTRGEVRKSIGKAINLSEMLVIIADFSDLTGTLPVWRDFLDSADAHKPYILVINKIDLLPARAKRTEVIEYLRQYLAHTGWKNPGDLILTSGIKGDGVSILAGSISKAVSPGAKIALLGATNAGKSSLIKRILTVERSPHSPTVSKFPGTTIGLSNWSILKGRNTLIDTPGLVSGDRIGDRLCPECAGQLLPALKMEQKLWGLKPGKGLIVGGLLGVEHLGNEEAVVIAFTSPQVNLHRTDNTKIKALLLESPGWLSGICQKCRPDLDWREETVVLKPNQDLAVAGLGWVSLRGNETQLRITLPKGVRWEVRPALVGKRE